MNDENLKAGEKTQFKSGEEAARAGRKGGIKSGAARRKKCASRKFLKEVLTLEPKKTPEQAKMLEKLGANPDAILTVEQLGVLALIKKYLAGDMRAYDMVHEYLGEDPRTLIEEERLKVQREAVNALKNSDGFMEAMGATVGEVFEDGGDTPDTLEDSE